MLTRSLRKRTALFMTIWLIVVAATIGLSNLIGGSRGEEVIQGILWPLPVITYAMSRAVDLSGDQRGAEPASADLSSREVGVLSVVAIILYLLLLAAIANVVARLSLRGPGPPVKRAS
jgi:hypothetical protein